MGNRETGRGKGRGRLEGEGEGGRGGGGRKEEAGGRYRYSQPSFLPQNSCAQVWMMRSGFEPVNANWYFGVRGSGFVFQGSCFGVRVSGSGQG